MESLSSSNSIQLWKTVFRPFRATPGSTQMLEEQLELLAFFLFCSLFTYCNYTLRSSQLCLLASVSLPFLIQNFKLVEDIEQMWGFWLLISEFLFPISSYYILSNFWNFGSTDLHGLLFSVPLPQRLSSFWWISAFRPSLLPPNLYPLRNAPFWNLLFPNSSGKNVSIYL